MHPAGANLERLTDDPAFDGQAPFSPDRAQLRGHFEVFTIRPDKSDVRRLTNVRDNEALHTGAPQTKLQKTTR
jgi:hypothetical protein